MQELLQTVLTRLAKKGGEIASIIRPDNQYGVSTTHGLISLVRAVRGMKGVKNIKEFLEPALLLNGPVRVAALDGENSDPADGLNLYAAAGRWCRLPVAAKWKKHASNPVGIPHCTDYSADMV
jgi:hypothetical protein